MVPRIQIERYRRYSDVKALIQQLLYIFYDEDIDWKLNTQLGHELHFELKEALKELEDNDRGDLSQPGVIAQRLWNKCKQLENNRPEEYALAREFVESRVLTPPDAQSHMVWNRLMELKLCRRLELEIRAGILDTLEEHILLPAPMDRILRVSKSYLALRLLIRWELT